MSGYWPALASTHLMAERQRQNSSEQLQNQTHSQGVHELQPNGPKRKELSLYKCVIIYRRK